MLEEDIAWFYVIVYDAVLLENEQSFYNLSSNTMKSILLLQSCLFSNQVVKSSTRAVIVDEVDVIDSFKPAPEFHDATMLYSSEILDLINQHFLIFW